MKYGVLNQTNEAYKPKLWEKLDDLYTGGFDILAHAKKYIPQQVGEPPERYEERIAHASYIGYLGMIVDAYAANLFAQEPVVMPADEDTTGDAADVEAFWHDFAADANLEGESFSKVLRDIFTTAVLKKRALIGCDFPRVAMTAETRAEEDRVGASRAYGFELCPEELLDWEYSGIVAREVKLPTGATVRFAYGLFSWAILKRRVQRRATPEDSRETFVEEFKVWRLQENGIASWQIYRTAPRKNGESPPSNDTELTVAIEGTTSFRQIPIVELTIPDGLWLGNKLGPIALEMFRRRSALHASENRNLFPIPVVKLGPEIGAVGGALPPERQQNPSRGDDALDPIRRMGGLVLGYQDDFEFVSPDGKVYEIVDKQLADLVDEFFRIAHMMAASVSNTTKALGRSGSSKEQDHRAMTIVLEAYGAIVRDFALRVYGLVGEARGETLEWKVHGLDKFDVVDRQIVLDEAKTMASVSIPSRTFNAHWKTKTAMSLLGNVPPEVQRTIQDEIKRGIVAEERMRDVMLGAADDAIDDHGDPTDDGADARNGGTSPRDRIGGGPVPPGARNGARAAQG